VEQKIAHPKAGDGILNNLLQVPVGSNCPHPMAGYFVSKWSLGAAQYSPRKAPIAPCVHGAHLHMRFHSFALTSAPRTVTTDMAIGRIGNGVELAWLGGGRR
jgi:hypothetical protein